MSKLIKTGRGATSSEHQAGVKNPASAGVKSVKRLTAKKLEKIEGIKAVVAKSTVLGLPEQEAHSAELKAREPGLAVVKKSKTKVVKTPKKKDGRGGAREGAGRKKNSGVFGEVTTPMRIPLSMLSQVEAVLEKLKTQSQKTKAQTSLVSSVKNVKVALPAVPAKIKDALEDASRLGKSLDLTAHIVKHPEASYALKVKDDTLANFGFTTGDLLIIDRAVKALNGQVVAAVVGGELVVRTLQITDEDVQLKANGKQKLVTAKKIEELGIWGVVVGLTRKL